MRHELTVLLCILWALTLLYGEMFAYWVPSLLTCSWPHLLRSSSSNSTSNSEADPAGYVKVAVITDPQLMDKTSLNLPPESLALEIAEFYTDLYMRRSFFASVLPFKPDVVLFLGDYFDGGPYLMDEEWQKSFSRFKHIFGLNEQGKYTDMQVYNIPGNHDIGYEYLHSQMPQVIRRYEETFGIRNYRFEVGNVDFIAIDAQTLDVSLHNPLQPSGQEFNCNWLPKLGNEVHPRVLLTHIPLYRPDNTYCGPQRSAPIVNQRVSRTSFDKDIRYQNYVTEDSSKNLMDMIKPKLILSGHDHDQCTVTHQSKFGPIKEQTLGTISWQQGNLYPSFMLMSVRKSTLPNASTPEDAVSTQLCFLPMQTHIYIWYIVLFILTVLAILLWPTSSTSFWHQCWNLVGSSRQLITSALFSGEAKEKDEDPNYEYEMMWDAEGSMHLVKKPLKASIVNSSERSLGERGNALMRPSARKLTSLEGDVSVNMEMASGNGLDPVARMPSKAGKSTTTFIIQRSIRMFRMIIVIAAVNVPLYMMLLFKDWIDK
ncbi:metallophosphoesterase 1-like [Senna tora]|uniref:Metallophosphoesterase 1-like n=1 Tax=Senna tora TaxID=362788 RepID=A0A835CLT1_9FABA|nr:metallophosphoesterase 1-like [Senna tora]